MDKSSSVPPKWSIDTCEPLAHAIAYKDLEELVAFFSKEFALSNSPRCMQHRLRRLLPRLSLEAHGQNSGMSESLA